MSATGLSAAKILKKLKAKVFCWDDNQTIRKKIKKINLNIDKFWLKNKIIDSIIVSPGIDIKKCNIKNY